MEIYFTKMHGTGNDFVMIDDLSDELELAPEQVRTLCDRHFGVGADGVILVRPPKNQGSTAYMHYLNADGSLAEMCGNGVRCFAKWLVDKGFVEVSESPVPSRIDGNLVRGGRFVADTLAGRRPIDFEVDENGQLTLASVDMGEPLFAPEAIPTTLAATRDIEVRRDGERSSAPAVVEKTLVPSEIHEAVELHFTCVNMGNPHAVTFDAQVWDFADRDFALIGESFESDTVLFPEKCNIEFAELLDPAAQEDGANIQMRVFERGVGETLACGTGACATAIVANITGRATRVSTVRVRGGLLRIEWREDHHVQLTGPASTVFEGTIIL